jgi:hypothetical protein
LSVDYYSLKERSAAAVGDRALQATAFVELPAPVLGGKHCRFELDDGAGATLRVHLQGYDTADLEILARRFGKAE